MASCRHGRRRDRGRRLHRSQPLPAPRGRAGIGRIVALDDLSTGSRSNLPHDGRIELLEGSILDRAALDAACTEADAIVHLAGSTLGAALARRPGRQPRGQRLGDASLSSKRRGGRATST